MRALALVLGIVFCLIVPSAAAAQGVTPAPVRPDYIPPTPDNFQISGEQALDIAGRNPVVAAMTASHGRLTIAMQVTDNVVWQVGYKDHDDDEVAQVKVDGFSGAVTEAWTGYQVAWPMARGNPGQFGHILNAPYVWIPLAVIFLVGLFDFRKPLRFAHLDLLVLLSFGISQAFFNSADIGISVPLAYPPLLYLFARTIWIGFRGGPRTGLRPSIPWRWLALAIVVLVAFRVTINIADSGVIDVGYAGTIGADRITHGETVWGEGEFPDDNRFGDTYGPANYYAYVPFELALPWSGSWDELPSSHAAAIAFDLATILGLFFFGLRLIGGEGGRRLGTLLAFAWVAYPYTTFALQSNSNDSLLAAFLAWSLALFARPLARGALLAGAVMTKFAPARARSPLRGRHRGAWPRLQPRLARGAADAAALRGGVRRPRRHPACQPGDRSWPGDVLRPHRRQPDRPHITVQRLGPGRRHPVVADGGVRGGVAARGCVCLRPAPPHAPAGRGAVGGRADRPPACRRPLVLPLHPVVFARTVHRPARRGRRPGRAEPSNTGGRDGDSGRDTR